MNTLRPRLMSIALLLCASISACDRGTSELPAISAANCTAENIAKISSESSRKEFAGRCAARNTFKPSEKRGW